MKNNCASKKSGGLRKKRSARKVLSISEFHRVVKKKGLSPETASHFQNIIYQYYETNARDSLPWRHTKDPYHILISEVMLQQTQVERVLQKYQEFIAAFPDIHSLAAAPLRKILSLWQGMGYNRRAMALKRTAEIVVNQCKDGRLPSDVDALMELPGVGRATASAVAAFGFQCPVVFIETNIRRVFIHFFFHERQNIRDSEILPLIEKTLDRDDPRSWYYALMDYGSMLKKTESNPNRRSAHYSRQSSFHGSNRQVRGLILKLLIEQPDISGTSIVSCLDAEPHKVKAMLQELEKEGFLKKNQKGYRIT